MEIKLFSKSMEEERDEIWINPSSAGLNQSRWGSLFHGERGQGTVNISSVQRHPVQWAP